jgi:hypothetical protein
MEQRALRCSIPLSVWFSHDAHTHTGKTGFITHAGPAAAPHLSGPCGSTDFA